MKKHVNLDGDVGTCYAVSRPCPFGEERHFSNEQDARKFFEEENKDNLFPIKNKKNGFTVKVSMKAEESDYRPGDEHSGRFIEQDVKRNFETYDDAVKWAEENISDATPIISVVNEDYDKNDSTEAWREMHLIDISKERQVINTQDIPKIAKFYLKQYENGFKDFNDMVLKTNMIRNVLSQKKVISLYSYLKKATYGKAS